MPSKKINVKLDFWRWKDLAGGWKALFSNIDIFNDIEARKNSSYSYKLEYIFETHEIEHIFFTIFLSEFVI